MLSPGTYHVITLGRRFIRHAPSGLVGSQLERAEKFASFDEALTAAKKLGVEAARLEIEKPIAVVIRVHPV